MPTENSAKVNRSPIEDRCFNCGADRPRSLDDLKLYGIPMSTWITDGRVIQAILDVMNEKRQDPREWADFKEQVRF